MRYSIEVKQKHIDEGRKLSPEYCPVALAIAEHLRIRAEVYRDKIILKKPKPTSLQEMLNPVGQSGYGGFMFGPPVAYNNFSFSIPDKVASESRRFDGGLKIAPFWFTLEIPPEIL